MKKNYLSDIVVVADQGSVIGLEKEGLKARTTTIYIETDVVGFVRACRDNEVDNVRYVKGGGGDFLICNHKTGGPDIVLSSDYIK